MRNRITAAAGLGGLILAGCAGHMPGEDIGAITKYPGLEQQMIEYYDDHALEDNWECPEVDMDVMTRAQVVKEDATSVKMAVHYDFQPDDGGGHGAMCRGFNTRFFTFDKTGGTLVLRSMSGEQR